MPRKSVKIETEDLKTFLEMTVDMFAVLEDKYAIVLTKYFNWTENEIKRREKAGKLGGRPKKNQPIRKFTVTAPIEVQGKAEQPPIEDEFEEPEREIIDVPIA